MELAIVMADAILFSIGLIFMVYLLFTDGKFTVENKHFSYDWSAECMRYRLKTKRILDELSNEAKQGNRVKLSELEGMVNHYE